MYHIFQWKKCLIWNYALYLMCNLEKGSLCHIEGWAQDYRKSDDCFTPNLISSLLISLLPTYNWILLNILWAEKTLIRLHEWAGSPQHLLPNFNEVGGAYCFWVIGPFIMLFLWASYLDNYLRWSLETHWAYWGSGVDHLINFWKISG